MEPSEYALLVAEPSINAPAHREKYVQQHCCTHCALTRLLPSNKEDWASVVLKDTAGKSVCFQMQTICLKIGSPFQDKFSSPFSCSLVATHPCAVLCSASGPSNSSSRPSTPQPSSVPRMRCVASPSHFPTFSPSPSTSPSHLPSSPSHLHHLLAVSPSAAALAAATDCKQPQPRTLYRVPETQVLLLQSAEFITYLV